MSGADCIIIGGGVMGCATALRLAQAGVKTTVLERAIPGAEASSAAAGILAAQEEAEGPGPLAELALASRARFAALADELKSATGVDIALRPHGVLSLAVDAAAEAQLEARYAWQRGRGLRVEWLRGAAVHELEPKLAPGWQAALHFPDDHQLDPRPYARALSLAAARAGAQFTTGAYVRRVLHERGKVVGVETEAGTLAAGHVVVAAGSWSALVDGAALPVASVKPVRGQMVKLDTRPPAVRGTIVAPGGYLVGRADGSVLAGSTMELAGFEKAVTAGGLHHVLAHSLALVPSLEHAPVVETWSNFRPTTDDHLPVMGRTPIEGLLLATGHYRNGILLSPISAEIIRDLVTGAAPAFDLTPFSVTRFAK